MTEEIKPFTETFDKIAYNKSDREVFNDFLDMTICALSLGQYEQEYLAIVKKYNPKEMDLFCELMARMLIIMDNDGQGLKDCLGEFFQTSISSRARGQFFTPTHVSDMMAAMTIN